MKLISIILFVLLFGCGSKPGDKAGEASKSFEVLNPSLESVKDLSQKNSFPQFEKSYIISATVTDSNTGNPIPDQNFVIDKGEEGREILKSDLNGKIRWAEHLSYFLTQTKKQVLVKRKIMLSKDRSKVSEIKFLLYPYANHLEEDISEFSLKVSNDENEYTNKLEISRKEKNDHSIELRDTDFKIYYVGPSVNGLEFRFDLFSSVVIGLSKMNGTPYDYHLKKEHFDIYFELSTKESGIFFSKYLSDVLLENGKINTTFRGTVKSVNSFEDVVLKIRMVPKSLSHEFRSFHGKMSIGRFGEISGTHELVFTKESNSRYSNFKILDIGNVKKEKSETQTLKFEKLLLQYDYIVEGETPTRKNVVYRSQTCVKDFYEDKEIIFEKFMVQKTTGEVIPLYTDGDGCLHWNESIKFKYYKPENFFTRTNIITHVKTGISKELTSYINPWTILTIGRDKRSMDVETLERIAKRDAILSSLFLEQYSFETINVTYHMDEFMTLYVRKNIKLDLEFGVSRYSSMDQGILANEDIRDGVYLLKVALEKNYIDTRKTLVEVEQEENKTTVKKSFTRKPLEYIYVVHKLVRVWKGHIITPVELSIHDLRLMTVRSNFLIQLQAIDQDILELSKEFNIEEIATERVVKILEKKFPKEELSLDLLVEKDSGLPSRTFTGPMILLEMEGGADVRPTDAINKCDTDDCNFLERNNKNLSKLKYDHDRKYYGGVNHLRGISVDDLLKQKKILDQKYLNHKKVESLLFNYLNNFNLLYISDDNEVLKSLPLNQDVVECYSNDIEDCFVENNSLTMNPQAFLSLFDVKDDNNDSFEIKDLFEMEVDDLLLNNEKLCKNLINKSKMKIQKRSFYPTYDKVKLNKMWSDLNHACEDSQTFSFNKVIRVGGINEFSFLGGKTINFDVGSGSSIEFSEGFSTEVDMSVEVSGEANPLGRIKKIGQLLGDIVGVGLGYSISGSSGTEYSYGDSSELTSTTYLAMQRATFDIKFENPILCMEIRALPSFIEKIIRIMNETPDVNLDTVYLAQGYFVCSKNIEQDKIAETSFRERYYYFAQHFTEGHMLDDGSILNHPWLLGLRGERDYLNFVKLLGRKPKTDNREIGMATKFFRASTDWYLDDSRKLEESFTKNNLAQLPLEQISNAFDNVSPSFPGLYVIRPNKKEYPYD